MYQCWRCKGETPNIKPDYFTEYYPGIYPDKYTSLCDKCSDELDEEREFENEQTNDNITCPACGYEFQDDECSYYKSDGEEYKCKECGAWFEITANHSIDFTTKRIKK
jgi:DNA-directed RNA polymerase subunit RPC12/RpoP